jgi:small-conductance mechanosensitive channel
VLPTRSLPPLAGIVLFTLLAACSQLEGQSNPQPAPATHTAPVTLRGETLFEIPGLLHSFSAEARAAAISRRLNDLARDTTVDPRSISVVDTEDISDIVAGDLVIMSVTDQDGTAAGVSRQALARTGAQRITAALLAYRRDYSAKSILLGSVYAVIASVVLILLLWLLFAIFRRLFVKLDSWRAKRRIHALRIQRFELLSADRVSGWAVGLARLLRTAIVVVALYFYLSLVLGFFPWTRGYAHTLLGYILAPLKLIGSAFVAYLPNLCFIAVMVVIAAYVAKFVRVLFTQIGKGTIVIPGFYSDWAEPTSKLARALILVLTVIIVFPYIPGSKSPAFDAITIFLGLLISLGSTSAVANVVGGIILIYMRAFKIGDYVKIADTVGDVIDKTLLVTRVRTPKNVEVTIANVMVLSSHIINFSAEPGNLILHTNVTIGYDSPWRTVHQLLIDAALACDDILKEPKPFVIQTALNDFNVRYEINAYTSKPNQMLNTYSDLYANIQDKFNEAGVEILSPHYASIREGNAVAIPDEYLPKNYTAPSFRLGLENILDPIKGAGKPQNQ